MEVAGEYVVSATAVPVKHARVVTAILGAGLHVCVCVRVCVCVCVCSGHSLGAGVASMLTIMMRYGYGHGPHAHPSEWADRVFCVAVACPPLVSEHVANSCDDFMLSLVRETRALALAHKYPAWPTHVAVRPSQVLCLPCAVPSLCVRMCARACVCVSVSVLWSRLITCVSLSACRCTTWTSCRA